MSENSQKVLATRQKRKREIVDIMGGCCSLCGYHNDETALELHHINQEDKEFSFNKYGSYPRYEILIPELQKCILLCANCHREVHNSKKGIELQSSFNLEKALYYKSQVRGGEVHEKYCIDCGKVLSNNRATRCDACEKIRQRVVERPSREELKELIRNKPFTQIGEQFHVSDNSIRKWCDYYSLTRKKTEIKNYSDEEWNLI